MWKSAEKQIAFLRNDPHLLTYHTGSFPLVEAKTWASLHGTAVRRDHGELESLIRFVAKFKNGPGSAC